MIDIDAIEARQVAGAVRHWSDIPGHVARDVCASAGYTNLDKCGIGVIKSAAWEIATEHAPTDIAALLEHAAALAHQAAVQAQRTEAAEAEVARLRAAIATVIAAGQPSDISAMRPPLFEALQALRVAVEALDG